MGKERKTIHLQYREAASTLRMLSNLLGRVSVNGVMDVGRIDVTSLLHVSPAT